jgi:GT2 family glycosyltransferase
MDALPVSVVIVSRNRPRWLGRCLLAVGQLDYPVFEVVVVACPSGCDIAQAANLPVDIEVTCFDEANISKARNIGISKSRGDVVAFIDDDAVPEPTWLTHLIAPFADTSVAQAGGTTLGRNGISVQHAAAWVSNSGRTISCPAPRIEPFVVPVKDGLHPRLHGTNMAIRRAILKEQGGFDPRFAFYLDETDMTLRISQAGGRTWYVPKAVVHHASGASAFRRADRAPRRLFEIGTSAGVFHQKHTPEDERDAARTAFVHERRTWLLRHLQLGTLGPEEVARLFKELIDGYDNGPTPDTQPQALPDTAAPVSMRRKDHRHGNGFLVTRPWNRKATATKAIDLVQGGATVTVFDYDATTRYHTVRFKQEGYWVHTGGIFGREQREEPQFQRASRDQRVRRTLARLTGVRSYPDLIDYN